MAAGPTGTVLVVEDDPHVLLLLERLVTAAGYGVLSAGSGAEALTVLSARGGEVDLLLTDISLGDMHGGELARRALEMHPGVRVIYSSGHPRASAALDGLPAGHAFLLKPYKPADLKRVLDEVSGRPRNG
jgi:CheY-like chemotaxis protein